MMDARSERLLAAVHPDLAKVIRAASQAPQAFGVVFGIRTVAQEREAVATGHSTTMHSRHLPNPRYTSPAFPGGLSCAVDTAAMVAGVVSFAPGHEEVVFSMIAHQVKVAAAALGVTIDWGGDWRHFKDWGHFELDWKAYP